MSLPTITFTSQSSTPLPTGEYAVRCIGIELTESKFEPSKQQLAWKFEIVSAGEHQGRKLTAYTSLSTSLMSKAARFASALAGHPLADGESIDLNSLVGRHAVAVVVCRAKPDGTEFSKLEDLKPLKTAQPAQPTQAQPAEGGSFQ